MKFFFILSVFQTQNVEILDKLIENKYTDDEIVHFSGHDRIVPSPLFSRLIGSGFSEKYLHAQSTSPLIWKATNLIGQPIVGDVSTTSCVNLIRNRGCLVTKRSCSFILFNSLTRKFSEQIVDYENIDIFLFLYEHLDNEYRLNEILRRRHLLSDERLNQIFMKYETFSDQYFNSDKNFEIFHTSNILSENFLPVLKKNHSLKHLSSSITQRQCCFCVNLEKLSNRHVVPTLSSSIILEDQQKGINLTPSIRNCLYESLICNQDWSKNQIESILTILLNDLSYIEMLLLKGNRECIINNLDRLVKLIDEENAVQIYSDHRYFQLIAKIRELHVIYELKCHYKLFDKVSHEIDRYNAIESPKKFLQAIDAHKRFSKTESLQNNLPQKSHSVCCNNNRSNYELSDIVAIFNSYKNRISKNINLNIQSNGGFNQENTRSILKATKSIEKHFTLLKMSMCIHFRYEIAKKHDKNFQVSKNWIPVEQNRPNIFKFLHILTKNDVFSEKIDFFDQSVLEMLDIKYQGANPVALDEVFLCFLFVDHHFKIVRNKNVTGSISKDRAYVLVYVFFCEEIARCFFKFFNCDYHQEYLRLFSIFKLYERENRSKTTNHEPSTREIEFLDFICIFLPYIRSGHISSEQLQDAIFIFDEKKSDILTKSILNWHWTNWAYIKKILPVSLHKNDSITDLYFPKELSDISMKIGLKNMSIFLEDIINIAEKEKIESNVVQRNIYILLRHLNTKNFSREDVGYIFITSINEKRFGFFEKIDFFRKNITRYQMKKTIGLFSFNMPSKLKTELLHVTDTLLESGWTIEYLIHLYRLICLKIKHEYQTIYDFFQVIQSFGIQLDFIKQNEREIQDFAQKPDFIAKFYAYFVSVYFGQSLPNDTSTIINTFLSKNASRLSDYLQQDALISRINKISDLSNSARDLFKSGMILSAREIKNWASKIERTSSGRFKESYAKLAILIQGIKFCLNIELRDNQILALLLAVDNVINSNLFLEIATGEGKTIIVAILAAYYALEGHKIDIITSSNELALPQSNMMQPFFSLFGISSENNVNIKTQPDCYKSDIIYTTISNIEADILRTEFLNIDRLKGRRQDICIIDEVDNVMIDEISSRTYLSDSVAFIEQLAPIRALIWHIVKTLSSQIYFNNDIAYIVPPLLRKAISNDKDSDHEYYILDVTFDTESEYFAYLIPKILKREQISINRLINLTDEQLNSLYIQKVRKYKDVYKDYVEKQTLQQARMVMRDLKNLDPEIRKKIVQIDSENIEFLKLKIPTFIEELFFSQYLQNYTIGAWRAIWILHENVNYIVENNQIIHVDHMNTGTLDKNISFGLGQQQFLEMKHGIPLTNEKFVTNYISNYTLLKRYNKMFGLSGTLSDKESEKFLKENFDAVTLAIPSFKTPKFALLPLIITDRTEKWQTEILKNILLNLKLDRTILVIMENIEEALQIKHFLTKAGIDQNLINLYERNENKQAIQKVLQPRQIIISTIIAGRGSDIQISDQIEHTGGLHICCTFLPKNIRVLRQILGRTSRNGKRGTAQFILSEVQLLNGNISKRNMIDIIIELSAQDEESNNKISEKLRFIHAKDWIFTKFCHYLQDMKYIKPIRDSVIERFGIWLLLQNQTIEKINTISAAEIFFRESFLQILISEGLVSNPIFLLRENESCFKPDEFDKILLNIDKGIALDNNQTLPTLYYLKAFHLIRKIEKKNSGLGLETNSSTIKTCLRTARQIIIEHILESHSLLISILTGNDDQTARFNNILIIYNGLLCSIRSLLGEQDDLDFNIRIFKNKTEKLKCQSKNLSQSDPNYDQVLKSIQDRISFYKKCIDKCEARIREIAYRYGESITNHMTRVGAIDFAIEKDMIILPRVINPLKYNKQGLTADETNLYELINNNMILIFYVKFESKKRPPPCTIDTCLEGRRDNSLNRVLLALCGIAQIAISVAFFVYMPHLFFVASNLTLLLNGFKDTFDAFSPDKMNGPFDWRSYFISRLKDVGMDALLDVSTRFPFMFNSFTGISTFNIFTNALDKAFTLTQGTFPLIQSLSTLSTACIISYVLYNFIVYRTDISTQGLDQLIQNDRTETMQKQAFLQSYKHSQETVNEMNSAYQRIISKEASGEYQSTFTEIENAVEEMKSCLYRNQGTDPKGFTTESSMIDFAISTHQKKMFEDFKSSNLALRLQNDKKFLEDYENFKRGLFPAVVRTNYNDILQNFKTKFNQIFVNGLDKLYDSFFNYQQENLDMTHLNFTETKKNIEDFNINHIKNLFSNPNFISRVTDLAILHQLIFHASSDGNLRTSELNTQFHDVQFISKIYQFQTLIALINEFKTPFLILDAFMEIYLISMVNRSGYLSDCTFEPPFNQHENHPKNDSTQTISENDIQSLITLASSKGMLPVISAQLPSFDMLRVSAIIPRDSQPRFIGPHMLISELPMTDIVLENSINQEMYGRVGTGHHDKHIATHLSENLIFFQTAREDNYLRRSQNIRSTQNSWDVITRFYEQDFRNLYEIIYELLVEQGIIAEMNNPNRRNRRGHLDSLNFYCFDSSSFSNPQEIMEDILQRYRFRFGNNTIRFQVWINGHYMGDQILNCDCSLVMVIGTPISERLFDPNAPAHLRTFFPRMHEDIREEKCKEYDDEKKKRKNSRNYRN